MRSRRCSRRSAPRWRAPALPNGARAERSHGVAEKAAVRTEEAPAPFQGSPYSQAIQAGGLVFVSGQVGLAPGAPGLVGEGIAEQTEQVFANLGAILEAA